MPHVLNRATQLLAAMDLTAYYGQEIENKRLGPSAMTDLLPELERLVDVDALNKFNEKCRKWIDAHPTTP